MGIVCLACQSDSSVLTLQFELPKKIKEISGMVYIPQTKMIWGLEDSGNDNVLFGLDANSGDLKKTCTITNASNVDWEELTKDAQGNVYIGDFGNNDNTRRDLCIYKIASSKLRRKKNLQTKNRHYFSIPKRLLNTKAIFICLPKTEVKTLMVLR